MTPPAPFPIHAYLIRDGSTPVLAVLPFWQSYGHLAIEITYALDAARSAGADLWLVQPPEGAANTALYNLKLGDISATKVYGPPGGYDWLKRLKSLGARPWSGCNPRTQLDVTNPGPYFFRKLLAGLEPLRFPDDLEETALSELEGMGVERGRPWVAVHARAEKPNSPLGTIRNIDIATYGLAIEWLQAQGYFIIRTGDPDSPPVGGPSVLDLAHHANRTALSEVYAVRGARMFLGCHSGPWAIAALCGVPSVISNVSDPFAPYPLHGTSRYLLRPAAYRGGRQLSPVEQLEGGYLKAILDPGYWRMTENPYALMQGANTPEEILAAVQEVMTGIANPPNANRGQVRWRQVAEQAAAHWSPMLPYVRKWAGSDGGWLGNGALAACQAEGL